MHYSRSHYLHLLVLGLNKYIEFEMGGEIIASQIAVLSYFLVQYIVKLIN